MVSMYIDVDKEIFHGLLGRGTALGQDVMLFKPTTYMNLSGTAVREVVSYFKIPLEDVIIIFDDMALEPGKIRLRNEGSSGGHKGMQNIIDLMGTGYLKPEDIEKSQVTLTYKDYVENNIYDIDSTPCQGNPKILVVPIWFTDSNLYIKANEKEQVRSDIEDAYFGSNTDTGWRSVKTYYEELSNNKIHLTGVVTDWYTCSESSRQYYNIKTGQAKTNQLVTTVVDWYREQSGDTTMTSFDSDHNGYLDGVMLIFIKGARITIRMHIIKAICTLLISVVILVTKLDEENLSILAKENDSIFLYKSLLKLAAKPTLALLPNTPPKIPQAMDTRAIPRSVIIRPNKETFIENPKLVFS